MENFQACKNRKNNTISLQGLLTQLQQLSIFYQSYFTISQYILNFLLNFYYFKFCSIAYVPFEKKPLLQKRFGKKKLRGDKFRQFFKKFTVEGA